MRSGAGGTDVLAAVRDLHVELPPGAALPHYAPIRRRARQTVAVDVEASVSAGIAELTAGLGPGGLSGMRVAVATGSRGVRDVVVVLAATVRLLRDAGAEPFVVPAMGSHGSSEAEGQLEVLADLGVTEQRVGAPVVATMETVVVGTTVAGVPVHLDRAVVESDGVFVVNRVKPHTDFAGDFGSGLAKMAAIGLGNAAGAERVHAAGSAALPRVIGEVVDVLRGTGRLLGGVAVIEDAEGRTADVTVVHPDGIAGAHERALLRRARELHGHLPFDDLDVLVVDAMGKDVSGAGMDTNVLGRFWVPGVDEPSGPCIAAVTVHRLTPASHGNASGIGLADLVPRRLLDQIDLRATYVNALTSGTGGLRRSRLPIVLPTDRDVVHAAVRMSGRADAGDVRLARIPDTLHPGRLLVSRALLEEVAGDPSLEQLGEPEPMAFTAEGELPPWPTL